MQITLPAGWRVPESKAIAPTASSGLTDFTFETPPGSACIVENAPLRLLRATKAGRCTVTVVQPGNAEWQRASKTATVEIAKGQPAFADAGNQSFEWRASRFPYAFPTTSTAGSVTFSSPSFGCDIVNNRLDFPLVSASFPRVCEITATSPETDGYVLATTPFTVEIRAIVVPVSFGQESFGVDTATIPATANVPGDLGPLIPDFVSGVSSGSCGSEIAGSAPNFTVTVNLLPGAADRTCTVEVRVSGNQFFSGGGGDEKVITFP